MKLQKKIYNDKFVFLIKIRTKKKEEEEITRNYSRTMKHGGMKFHRNFYQLLRRVLDTMGLNVTGHEPCTRKTKHWKVQDHQGLLLLDNKNRCTC